MQGSLITVCAGFHELKSARHQSHSSLLYWQMRQLRSCTQIRNYVNGDLAFKQSQNNRGADSSTLFQLLCRHWKSLNFVSPWHSNIYKQPSVHEVGKSFTFLTYNQGKSWYTAYQLRGSLWANAL